MAKNRYVNTHFWSDNYISELDPIEKLLFLYFLTNPFTNICGAYEITLKQIANDTGIDKEMILKIIDRFREQNKIYYIDGWIYIKNFSKHQNQGSDKVKAGIDKNMQLLPDKLKKFISDTLKGIDTHSHLNYNLNSNLNSNLNLNPNPKAGGDFVNDIIEIFKSEFKEIKHIDYVVSNIEQERSAVGKILNRYKEKNPEANSEKCLEDLRKDFKKFIEISINAKSEYLQTISLTKLNSKYSDYEQLTLKNNGINKPARRNTLQDF